MVLVADDICYLLSSMVISGRVPESGVCVSTECAMVVMCCIQCCMSVLTVLKCVDVLSREGIYIFAIVMWLVL